MFLFRKQQAFAPAGPVEYLVVGLGNPGVKYENTRHNAGFIALDLLAEQCNVKIKQLRFKALCADVTVSGHRALLIKPQTFMNLSGQSVTEAMRFYKIPPERTLILFDDISVSLGRLRIRRKGSDGGHNGMKNIIYLSGKDTFPRIKIGIGAKPNPEWELADWVLSSFNKEEQKLLLEAAEHAADAVKLILQDKTDEAMNRFNG